MGFAADEMLDVVSSLMSRNLYKSMTSHADHKVWHDVYHIDTAASFT
jgi:motility quorum-sensing regulator/GCU-specific mRNA interferase toxin